MGEDDDDDDDGDDDDDDDKEEIKGVGMAIVMITTYLCSPFDSFVYLQRPIKL